MRLICIFVLMLLPLAASSQEEAFYVEFKNESFAEAFTKIEHTYDVLFSYNDYDISKKRISLKRQKRTLAEVLEALKLQTKLYYKIIDNRYIVVNKFPKEKIKVNELDIVVVRSYLTKGIRKINNGSFTLSPSELGVLPGLVEPDVLESIQLLPGILSPNETASGFFVRGGASDQNRVIWDGINIYHKGHLFGMISPFNPNVTSKIKFINKGSHARYGERLSSVIDMSSNSNISQTVKAQLGFNGINGDALIEVPIIKDKLNIQGSLRRSYTDVLETFTFNQLADKVFESTKVKNFENENNEFSFVDYNLKLNFKPNKNNSLYASMISIDNQFDYILNDAENNKRFNDKLVSSNMGYGLGWKVKWNKNTTQNTTAFFSDYKLNYNFITREGDVQISDFEKRNTIFDSGVSSEVIIDRSKANKFTFGYQYALKDVAYAFLNTTNLSFILDTEHNVIQTHSLYGQYDYKNPKLFNLSFGLRSTYFNELDAVRLEPRLVIYKPLTKNLKLQGSAEIKNQIISEIDETILSDLSLENRLWRLADGNAFPIINSRQVSAGFIYIKKGLSIDIDTYYKKLYNITALSLGFLNPVNSSFNIGQRNIIGLDVFAQKQFNGFNSWLSYSLNQSQSRFENLNNNKDFTSKSNVTHSVSAALSYKFDGFQFALGWKWQTGKPYTIANDSSDGLEFNDGINTGELPIYHRLDLSSTYNFKMSKYNKLRGKIGLSIRNIYNRTNLISKEYRGNNSIDDPIELIEKLSIGITPNLMFRIYW